MKLRQLPWRRWMEVIIPVGVFFLVLALFVPFVLKARNDARKSTSRNNLKQIGIALHNYHETHQCFPPGGTIDESGVAFHGWGMQIIPHLDASPYYDMINQDRPWNDVENAHVFRFTYPVYQMPDVKDLATTDGYFLTHYLGNPNVFHRNSHVTLYNMKSGQSYTWLSGEIAGNYQPWGYPFNWRPLGTQLNQGPMTFGRPTEDGAIFLMGDGAVRFLENDVSADVLAQLANAPPVAAAEKIAVPSRHFEY